MHFVKQGIAGELTAAAKRRCASLLQLRACLMRTSLFFCADSA